MSVTIISFVKTTFLSLQARGTSPYLHFVVFHLFYGTPSRLKYCSVVYNVCSITVCSSSPSARRFDLKGNPVKYVICKMRNKCLLSNWESLTSFMKNKMVETNCFSLCWFWCCSMLVEWQLQGSLTSQFCLFRSIYAGQGGTLFLPVCNSIMIFVLSAAATTGKKNFFFLTIPKC